MNPLHLYRLDRREGDRTIDLLTVFLAADELPEDLFAGRVEEEIDANLVPDEILVVVRAGAADGVVDALRHSPSLETTRTRIGPRTAVTVVAFDRLGMEAQRIAVLGDAAAASLTLADYLRQAVTAIFRKHGGFVEANESFHFRNPSGRHTDRFIRLSNLLVRQAEISLIAATMLPHVPGDAFQVFVDTPAMFALVAALNEHLRAFEPGRASLGCDSFRSYGGMESFDFSRGARAAVFISASSSGGMAREISKLGVEPQRIATVLYLGPPIADLRMGVNLAFDAVANPRGIETGRRTYESGKCALCDAGSLPVLLQGDQFDLGGPRFDPILLKRADAPETMIETMGRLAGKGMLGVSLAQGTAAKQYVVDAGLLLAAAPFQDRLSYFARRFIPRGVRECIFIDAGSAALAMKLFRDEPQSPSLIGRDAIDTFRADDVDVDGRRLDGQPLLVVAAVIESGRSLLDVSRDLRSTRGASPLIYLVGLAKSASTSHREQLAATLRQTSSVAQHEVAIVEQVVLPPGSIANAWLQERIFLTNAKDQGIRLSDTLEARLSRLSRTIDPLVDELFLGADERTIRVQPGFVYWPPLSSAWDAPSQADVFYTVSSVLQHLRSTPPKPGARKIRTNWFQQTLLDPSNFSRFNDGAIQAALLRAARPAELDYASDTSAPTLQREVGRVLERIVKGARSPRGEAACEVLIAIGTRRLTLPKESLEALLAVDANAPSLVTELTALCRQRLLDT